jgi:hypothetical protein
MAIVWPISHANNARNIGQLSIEEKFSGDRPSYDAHLHRSRAENLRDSRREAV